MIKQRTKKKLCPLLDQECLGNQCEIYEERLNRCIIPVIAYNLYVLSETLKQSEGDRETAIG
jgi:hypothetical protein